MAALASSYSADLPDRARAGNLHERTVRSSPEPGGRTRLTEVPQRAVIHEVRAAIRTELQVCRAVDPLDSIIREGLVTRVVDGKLRLLDLQRLAWPAEVHELDVMPGFR